VRFEVSTALVLRTSIFWIVTGLLPPLSIDDPYFLWLLIPATQHKAKSSWKWAYYLITAYHFVYIELSWYESQICSKSRWCHTCWWCKHASFAESDLKWMKQSFHLLKLEEPLSCGGTQRRKLLSRSFLCSRIMVSILHLCKH